MLASVDIRVESRNGIGFEPSLIESVCEWGEIGGWWAEVDFLSVRVALSWTLKVLDWIG